MNTAARETVTSEGIVHEHGADIPMVQTVIQTNDVRATVVAKFRELADRLERGELNGASIQWNDNPDQPAMAIVEAFPPVPCVTEEDRAKYGAMKRVTRLIRSKFEPLRRFWLV